MPLPRLAAPRMLLIGAMGRNAGKTELAAEIIRRRVAGRRVIGVKTTTIDRRDGTCPRGGEGCGVCSSLEGEWELLEERSVDGPKDTCRLLAAGAARVYWLRGLRPALRDGWEALLRELDPQDLIVAESNSLADVVRPGVFLMVSRAEETAVKSSAHRVLPLVDRIVRLDLRRKIFDLDLDRLVSTPEGWGLTEEAGAIILAGGRSERMQEDKGLLPVEGVPLIARVADRLRPHFPEILVGVEAPGKYGFLGLPEVPDESPGLGPLMGLAATLGRAAHDLNLVVACDMPEVNLPLARRLLKEAAAGDYDAVVPCAAGERLEPLHAVYHRRLAPLARRVLSEGKRTIRAMLDECRVLYHEIDALSGPLNINDRHDYETYLDSLPCEKTREHRPS